MKTPLPAPAGATKTLWGVICLALATIVLLAWVWSGNHLGLFWTLAVLAAAGAGTILILCGVNETQDSLLAIQTLEAAPTAGIPVHLESMVAEIALLAWKVEKRAQKEPNPPKPILRNAGRIIELLRDRGLEIVSYEGRTVDPGARVERMEGVSDADEGRVVAEHEPEIQVNGKLAHRAVLSIGTRSIQNLT